MWWFEFWNSNDSFANAEWMDLKIPFLGNANCDTQNQSEIKDNVNVCHAVTSIFWAQYRLEFYRILTFNL